ncbi:hypothetical protein [Algoriphagus resistens]|nr:hypothetical protein [Algoriphagus resistens]
MNGSPQDISSPISPPGPSWISPKSWEIWYNPFSLLKKELEEKSRGMI